MICEDCQNTGYYGCTNYGIRGNTEYVNCDCGNKELCRAGCHPYTWIGEGVPWCDICDREVDLSICRQHHVSPTNILELVRDDQGYAQAIAKDGVFLIHLQRGTVRNEQYAECLVNCLNETLRTLAVIADPREELPPADGRSRDRVYEDLALDTLKKAQLDLQHLSAPEEDLKRT